MPQTPNPARDLVAKLSLEQAVQLLEAVLDHAGLKQAVAVAEAGARPPAARPATTTIDVKRVAAEVLADPAFRQVFEARNGGRNPLAEAIGRRDADLADRPLHTRHGADRDTPATEAWDAVFAAQNARRSGSPFWAGVVADERAGRKAA